MLLACMANVPQRLIPFDTSILQLLIDGWFRVINLSYKLTVTYKTCIPTLLSDVQLFQGHKQLDQSRKGDLETLRAALRGGEPFASLHITKRRYFLHKCCYLCHIHAAHDMRGKRRAQESQRALCLQRLSNTRHPDTGYKQMLPECWSTTHRQHQHGMLYQPPLLKWLALQHMYLRGVTP